MDDNFVRGILFADSDGGAGRWTMVCSLIKIGQLDGTGPCSYLKDVLERMILGHP